MKNTTEGAVSAESGARMLQKVGDFVEPLTRFDKSHLKLIYCSDVTVPIVVTQTFEARFNTSTDGGNGALPKGIQDVTSDKRLETELEAMLGRARQGGTGRLAAWTKSNGANPKAILRTGDVFESEGPVGFTITCESCDGEGKVKCSTCHGERTVTCTKCNGSGQMDCPSCHGAGQTKCGGCGGSGSVSRMVPVRGRNPVTGEVTITNEHAVVTCERCAGKGSLLCSSCHGARKKMCHACLGARTVSCQSCAGSGTTSCRDCGGEGQQYRKGEVACEIAVGLNISVDTKDDVIRSELSGLRQIDQIIAIADDYSSQANINGMTVTRVTTARIRVASARFAIGEKELTINGYGQNLEVVDYRDIGSLLLSGDIESLETALSTGKGVLPALAGVLQSEMNAKIVNKAGSIWSKKRASALKTLSDDVGGFTSQEYAVRVATAVRTGTRRAYLGKLLRWPIVFAILPFVPLPLNYFTLAAFPRDNDGALILTVMIASLVGAFAGNWWAMRTLEKEISPDQELNVRQLIRRLGYSRNWLILTCFLAVVGTFVCDAVGRAYAGF